MSAPGRLRIVFLGVAHMHARTYASLLPGLGGDVAGVWDPDPERAAAFAAAHGCRRVGAPADLAAAQPDAIVVAGTNREHRMLVELAAGLGVPILLEKPLAASLEDAAAIRDLVRPRGLRVFMALPMRFATSVRRAKAVLSEGGLGAVRAVTATNHGKVPSGWFVERAEAGGGAVLDHTIHLVDTVRWLIGAEPEEVFAVASGQAGQVERFGLVSLRFSGGIAAALDPSWAHPAKHPLWPDFTLRLLCDDGVLEVDAFRQTITLCGDREGVRRVVWGDDEDAAMLRAFLDFARRREAGEVPGVADAWQAQRVVEAAYRSIRDGRAVPLDEVDE